MGSGSMTGCHADADSFDRRPYRLGMRLLIESVCINCGCVIVGSTTETLEQDERDHLTVCPGKTAAAAQ